MIRRSILGLVLVIAGFLAAPATAGACPMCKNANETDDHRPRAYMISILFMLAVPATIFTGLSVGLYRLSKRENAAIANGEWSGDGFASNPTSSDVETPADGRPSENPKTRDEETRR